VVVEVEEFRSLAAQLHGEANRHGRQVTAGARVSIILQRGNALRQLEAWSAAGAQQLYLALPRERGRRITTLQELGRTIVPVGTS